MFSYYSYSDQATRKPIGKCVHFCKHCTNTFGYKEMGHWGTKDVKVESALAKYPDDFVLEIEQEQLPYEFLLPLCVSQIKSTIRVTSLMIFASIFFLSCFFALIFCFFLKGDSSDWTIYYLETFIIYAFGCNFKGDLVWCSFPVYEILLLQCGLGSKLISGIWIPGGCKHLTSLSFWKLNSVGIQRQERDMGHVEEGQLETAAWSR